MADRTLAPNQIAKISVVFLALFSFIMTAHLSRTVFDRLPHLEDELAYTWQARVFADGKLVAEIPEQRSAFWQPFVVNNTEDGTRFSKYTPGWSAVLAIGLHLGQPWVINAFFAMMTVVLAYRLGLDVFRSQHVGLVAAALTAFSPMTLLLSSTLMGHTAAIFSLTLFMVAYRRIEIGQKKILWGILAGIALGLLIINRPSTAIAVTIPFILWAGLRLLNGLAYDRSIPAFIKRTIPFALLSVIAIVIAGFVPLYNNAATGDPGENLYLRVWSYDRLGFGDGYGRNGHTIVKGVAHARFDLSLTAADLFGWTMQRPNNEASGLLEWEPGQVTEAIQQHLRTEEDYFPLVGLSFFILPVGLWFGFKRWWLRAWILIALVWLIPPLRDGDRFLLGLPRVVDGGWLAFMTPHQWVADSTLVKLVQNFEPIWQWLATGAVLLVIPVPILAIGRQFTPETDDQSRWTWMLLAVAASLIALYMAYWVGSQRYSTRYYSEAVTALSLIAALGFVGIARLIGRTGFNSRRAIFAGYAAFSVLLVWSLFSYSLPRIDALRHFNRVSDIPLEHLEAIREDERPVLILATTVANSPLRWRSYGTFMSQTRYDLSGDIVAAWNYSPDSETLRSDLFAMFPEHQVIELAIYNEEAWLTDCYDGEDPNAVPPECVIQTPRR